MTISNISGVNPYTSTAASTAAGQTNASNTSFQQLFAQITGVGQQTASTSSTDPATSATAAPQAQGAMPHHHHHHAASSSIQSSTQASQTNPAAPVSDDGDDIASLIASLGSGEGASPAGASSTGAVTPAVDIFA